MVSNIHERYCHLDIIRAEPHFRFLALQVFGAGAFSGLM